MGELRQRGRIWWIRYYRNGRRHGESAHSEEKQAAIDLLRIREGDVARGVPVTARFRFDEAAADLLTEYRINDRRSLDELEWRLEKHLLPYFSGRRMASITTADVRAYVAHRQQQGIVAHKGKREGERIGDVSNGEINRELQHLKRIFNLAVCKPKRSSARRTSRCSRNGTRDRGSSNSPRCATS